MPEGSRLRVGGDFAAARTLAIPPKSPSSVLSSLQRHACIICVVYVVLSIPPLL